MQHEVLAQQVDQVLHHLLWLSHAGEDTRHRRYGAQDLALLGDDRLLQLALHLLAMAEVEDELRHLAQRIERRLHHIVAGDQLGIDVQDARQLGGLNGGQRGVEGLLGDQLGYLIDGGQHGAIADGQQRLGQAVEASHDDLAFKTCLLNDANGADGGFVVGRDDGVGQPAGGDHRAHGLGAEFDARAWRHPVEHHFVDQFDVGVLGENAVKARVAGDARRLAQVALKVHDATTVAQRPERHLGDQRLAGIVVGADGAHHGGMLDQRVECDDGHTGCLGTIEQGQQGGVRGRHGAEHQCIHALVEQLIEHSGVVGHGDC